MTDNNFLESSKLSSEAGEGSITEGTEQFETDDSADSESKAIEELPDALSRVEKFDPAAATTIKEVIRFQSTMHHGPMPSPDDLERYSQIQPDLPERMMRMAESSLENKSRHNDKILLLKDKELDINRHEIDCNFVNQKREFFLRIIGLVSAAIFVLLLLFFAFYAMLQDKESIAIIIVSTTIGTVLVSFLGKQFFSRSSNKMPEDD